MVMTAFDWDELAGLQAAQVSAMQDTCVILVCSETRDALNHPVPTWTAGEVTTCGVDMSGGAESRLRGRVIEQCEALIRLPLGTVISQKDRIRVTFRFGVMQGTQIVYDIVGTPMEGPSGVVAPCAVTNPKVG